ncbi:hypothetical protein [Paenibacillus thermotolerans]|uniref:hypothetical protein n=1 Tax=Paenibacillus thermotolerans TaxID=3027807 RepID=UPI0023689AF8|nr:MULTISPECIES: hypothetical protein [unclassified Paenibacillus]
MDDKLWFKDLEDLDLEDLVQLKLSIGQGKLPADDWHRKPSTDCPEGITMDEWILRLEKEFQRLGI